MSEFSSNDIFEAKKRVREMREKAKGFVDEKPKEEAKPLITPPKKSDAGIGELLSGLLSNEDSSLILAIVLILAREKADNMLILALLYILL